VISQHPENGTDFLEESGRRLLGGAEPKQLFERSAITPVVAELAEPIEFGLAHEADEDESVPDGVVPDAHAEICGEFQTDGKT